MDYTDCKQKNIEEEFITYDYIKVYINLRRLHCVIKLLDSADGYRLKTWHPIRTFPTCLNDSLFKISLAYHPPPCAQEGRAN